MDNRDAIIKTIDKIAQLSKRPENKWLLDELRSKWGYTNPPTCDNDSISNIERYLAIDYNIDEMAIQIDYSFVKDKVLRLKLEADWREMLRYRCGVRKHEPDFLEFCRYANLQAEGIINYYCHIQYGSEASLKRACGINEDKNVTYYSKIKLLKGFVPYSIRNFLYEKLYQARNIQSHRGVEIGEKHAWIQEQTRKSGLPVHRVGENLFVDRYKCTVSESLMYEERYNDFIENLKNAGIDYLTYEAKIWAKSSPYDEVENSLCQLVAKIKENIKK